MTRPSAIQIQRSSDALSRRVGPDILVTTPDDLDVHELSGGASAVWLDLYVPRTIPELVSRLAIAHGVPSDEIADQVETCVSTLTSLGVVEEAGTVDE